ACRSLGDRRAGYKPPADAFSKPGERNLCGHRRAFSRGGALWLPGAGISRLRHHAVYQAPGPHRARAPPDTRAGLSGGRGVGEIRGERPGGSLASYLSARRLISTMMPEISSAAPARRFIQANQRAVILSRSRPTPPLKSSHQAQEPQKTPAATRAADRLLLPEVPTPRPVKMVANESIVSGLARVSS